MDKCSSEVPGGVSMIRASSSPQVTSVKNCLIRPFFRGPRQIIASSCGHHQKAGNEGPGEQKETKKKKKKKKETRKKQKKSKKCQMFACHAVSTPEWVLRQTTHFEITMNQKKVYSKNPHLLVRQHETNGHHC